MVSSVRVAHLGQVMTDSRIAADSGLGGTVNRYDGRRPRGEPFSQTKRHSRYRFARRPAITPAPEGDVEVVFANLPVR